MSGAGWWNVDSLTLGHDWSVRHRFAPGVTDRTLCGIGEIWGRSRPEGAGPQCTRCMSPAPDAPPHERPCASPGLLSYRYRGRYGWIMIGARDDADALNEATRSQGPAAGLSGLQKGNGVRYESIPTPVEIPPRECLVPVTSRLSEAIRNARLRGDQVVHLDEIESPDRGVLIAFEGRWVWAEYRDGKLRDSATRAPASSVLAFADYAQWREAFGR